MFSPTAVVGIYHRKHREIASLPRRNRTLVQDSILNLRVMLSGVFANFAVIFLFPRRDEFPTSECQLRRRIG